MLNSTSDPCGARVKSLVNSNWKVKRFNSKECYLPWILDYFTQQSLNLKKITTFFFYFRSKFN